MPFVHPKDFEGWLISLLHTWRLSSDYDFLVELAFHSLSCFTAETPL